MATPRRRALRSAVLFAAAAAAAAPATPSFLWSQSEGELRLKIAVRCASEREVAIGVDEFSLNCTGADGRKYALSFVLREDLAAEGSGCETTTGGEEECVLRKRDPHAWDALTVLADQRRLKGLMKKDWKGEFVNKGDETAEKDDEDDYFEGTPVQPLRTAGDFDRWIDKTMFGVLDVALPWCSKCRHTKEQFVRLAREMRKEAKYAYVDAREVRPARRLFEPECDYACPFYVWRKGEPPYRLNHDYEEDRMLDTIRSYSTPLVTQLDRQKAAAFRAKHKACAIATIRGDDPELLDLLRRVARQTRGLDSLPWGRIEHPDAPPGKGVITMYKHDADRETNYDGPMELEALSRWANVTRHPLLRPYSWAGRAEVDASGLPNAQLFVDEQEEDAADAVHAAAEAARALLGEAVFFRIGKDNTPMMEEFGWRGEVDGPRLGLASSFDNDKARRYCFSGSWSPEAVAEWARAAAAGTARRCFRSASSHEATLPTPGEVQSIIGSTLLDAVDAQRSTFVVFHKSYMLDGKLLMRELDMLAQVLRGVPDFVVAQMETGSNQFDKTLFGGTDGAHKQPVGFLLGRGATPIKFFPRRLTAETTLKWLRKNSPAVAEKWDNLLVAMAQAEKRAREEREQAVNAERKTREELAQYERVNVTGDGGVVKYIVEAGSGESSPAKGDRVRANYTATVLSTGVVWDSSNQRGESAEFVLGEQMFPDCWEEAVPTMVTGEKAVLLCSAEYGFKDIGNAPHIKPGASLRYDIELLSFESAAGDSDSASESDEL
eukprot:TRINITY_DN65109_c0_g1_i1.p1 TRINITY_DN65109_c0_g1~~TRINITY_DN65109_c0_g1_i1.p1  ORF type:complete len:777 (+),score=256.83 TRINITY_DN65109_c0_g1_i1:81-2411(+)